MFIKFIIPCYNVGNQVGRMIDSILGQTFQDFHIVCVEDCSTDNTLEVLNSYKEKFPEKITIIENPNNMGPGETRNRGLYLTQDNLPSEFIWMVDGDDELADKTVLKKIYDFSVNNPIADMICVGFKIHGMYRVASESSPAGPVALVLKPSVYVPYLHENVQGCEDVYQHCVQWDSVEESRIGKLDALCYIYTGAGRHRAETKLNSAKVVIEALKKCQFKKQRSVDDFLSHIPWYRGI